MMKRWTYSWANARTDLASARRAALRFAALLAVAAWALPVVGADKSAPKPLKALLVTGGCCHDYTVQKELLSKGLMQRAHIDVVVVEQGGRTTNTKIPLYEDPKWAEGFDVVLHDECFADIPDAEWTQRVLAPHKAGLPAVLIHCAMHCYRDKTDEWFKFCGVTSHRHGKQYAHEVRNQDADHPIMKNFGKSWMNPKGELYWIEKVWPTAHPLAVSTNQEKGNDEVCVWTNEYGEKKTRVFGTTLGHHNETVSSPEFLDLVTRGTLWACGKLDDTYLKKADTETTSAKAEAAAEPIRPTDEPIRLFNGRNLDGFYTWMKDTKYEDPRKVFSVKEGMLYISGDGLGAITTKNAYRDYHLVIEFKFGEKTWPPREDKARDSGVLVHCTGPDGAYSGTWMNSIEAQIIEGGCGDFIVVRGTGPDGKPLPISLSAETTKDRDGETVWKAGGEKKTLQGGRVNWYGRDPDWADKKGFRGKQDVESPFGEWTRMDVVCEGGRITNYVNGVKVNEAFDAQPASGKIQLQTELAEMWVRRWELWPLGKAPKYEAPAKPRQER